MKIADECASCMLKRQQSRCTDPSFLRGIQQLLDRYRETESSPEIAARFEELYAGTYGSPTDWKVIKKQYNDLVLLQEETLEREIEQSEDPLFTSILYARTGNYIDFGALEHVHPEEFIRLLKQVNASEQDRKTYASFLRACEKGNRFLLAADNCGEIVLDKLMIRQLKKRFPSLAVTVLVRGSETFNDATEEDALYAGVNPEADIITNGTAIAGTVYQKMPEESRRVFDMADVILAKGQGNYESLSGTGRHIFFTFLCKCDLFVRRFGVPRFTGMFIEEGPSVSSQN